MNDQELTQAIRDYIKSLYSANYNGYLKAEKVDSEYKMSIGVPSYMFPTVIAGNFDSDEDFLNYIYEELRTRNYMKQDHYKVVKLDKEGIVPTPLTTPSYEYI